MSEQGSKLTSENASPSTTETRHQVRESFIDDLKRLGASKRLIKAAEKARESAQAPRHRAG